MPDFSKCRGDDCTVKHLCYRFTAPPSEMQSWGSFHATTRIANGGCIYFVSNANRQSIEQSTIQGAEA